MRDLRRLVGELHRRSLWQVRRAIATGALDSMPEPWGTDLSVAAALAFAGVPGEGAAVLRDWLGSAGDPAEREWGSRVANARGEIALAEGRLDTALAAFREARDLAVYCPLCGLADFGRVHEAAGRPDSAVAA